MCSICYQNFGEEDDDEEEPVSHIPVTLPCGHTFGRDCIAKWLADETTCPYCRKDYGAEGEAPENF